MSGARLTAVTVVVVTLFFLFSASFLGGTSRDGQDKDSLPFVDQVVQTDGPPQSGEATSHSVKHTTVITSHALPGRSGESVEHTSVIDTARPPVLEAGATQLDSLSRDAAEITGGDASDSSQRAAPVESRGQATALASTVTAQSRGGGPACAAQQVEYYTSRWNTSEFYTDVPLTSFWERLNGKWPTPCGEAGERTVVVDVGTHVGDQLEYWEANFGKGKSCGKTTFYLFEPNPETFKSLLFNMKRLRMGRNFHPVKAAVTNFTGTQTLFFNRGARPNKDKNQMASLGKVRGDSAAAGGGTSVKVYTMDDFLREPEHSAFDRITLLKIDTEGFDATVLYGAEQLLPKTRYVVYECHKLWHTGSGDRLKFVTKWLSDRGFLSYKVGTKFFLRLYGEYFDDVYDTLINWQNCIAIRQGDPIEPLLPTLC